MSDKRFSRLPGADRRYFDTYSGQTVSRRQRDNIIRGKRPDDGPIPAREAYKPLVETDVQRFQRLQKVRAYKKLRDDFMMTEGLTPKETIQDPRFRQIVRDLRSKNPETRKRGLIAAGLRKGLPSWVKPGESPKGWTKLYGKARSNALRNLTRRHARAQRKASR